MRAGFAFGASGRSGCVDRQAQGFALAVKADMLADTLEDASRSVLRILEASPLLWGRSRKLQGTGPKRPPHLDLKTVREALREAYTNTACADFRAVGALALTGDYNPAERRETAERFNAAIDGEALAKKVLRAVEVETGWQDDLYE